MDLLKKGFYLIVLTIVFLLLMAGSVSCAENTVFTVNFDKIDANAVSGDDYVRAHLQSESPALRVRMHLTDSPELQQEVSLTISRSDTCQVVFEKRYGLISGDFQSEVIYLPFSSSEITPYLITLQTDATRHVLPYLQKRGWEEASPMEETAQQAAPEQPDPAPAFETEADFSPMENTEEPPVNDITD